MLIKTLGITGVPEILVEITGLKNPFGDSLQG